MKIILGVVVVFVGLAAGLFEYSSYEDRKNFSAAKNDCERGCIQDSGGIDQCRPFCADHPDHYP